MPSNKEKLASTGGRPDPLLKEYVSPTARRPSLGVKGRMVFLQHCEQESRKYSEAKEVSECRP
jgi:hypothetical protein